MSFHIYVQWNPDFSSHRGKGKWVRIIGRFEKSGIQLQSLTGERKLGLVRISGGRFPFTKTFRKRPLKGPSKEERLPFDTSSIRLCSRPQNAKWWQRYWREQPGTCDSLWKLVNGICISTGKFPTGKLGYLFKTPLIPGNFPVERPENVSSISIPAGISW